MFRYRRRELIPRSRKRAERKTPLSHFELFLTGKDIHLTAERERERERGGGTVYVFPYCLAMTE